MKTKIDILAERTARNWSQQRLAEELGVKQASVSRWEDGKPMTSTAQKLFEIVLKNNPPVKRRHSDEATI